MRLQGARLLPGGGAQTGATPTWPASRSSARWTTTVWTRTPVATRSASPCAGRATCRAAAKPPGRPSATRPCARAPPAWRAILTWPASRWTAAPTGTVLGTRPATTATVSTPASSPTRASSRPSARWRIAWSTVTVRPALRAPREPPVQRVGFLFKFCLALFERFWFVFVSKESCFLIVFYLRERRKPETLIWF